MLWAVVAGLALWQLRTTPRTRRLAWRVGWVSCGLVAAAIAVDEFHGGIKDSTDTVAPWLWIALLAPAASPLLIAAALVLLRVTRGRPVLRSLLWLCVAIAVPAVLWDGFYGRVGAYSDFWVVAEEGSELMVSAMLIVIISTWRSWERRWTARPVVFLIIVGLALVAPLAAEWETAFRVRWGLHRPTEYTGPLGTVEQSVWITRDYLTSITVPAFVDAGESAGLTLRLRDEHRVVRESHAQVTHPPWSDRVATFWFEPIPTSGRQTYDVMLWASGSSPPYVFVGLSGSDERLEDVVRINGMPTTFNNVLALEGQYVVRRGVWLVADEIRADLRFALTLAVVVGSLTLWLWSVWLTAGRLRS